MNSPTPHGFRTTAGTTTILVHLAFLGCNPLQGNDKSARHTPSSMPEFEVLPSAMPFLESEGAPRLHVVLAASVGKQAVGTWGTNSKLEDLWNRGFWTCAHPPPGNPWPGITCNANKRDYVRITPWAKQKASPQDPWLVQRRLREVASQRPGQVPRQAVFLPVHPWVQAGTAPTHTSRAYALVTSYPGPASNEHQDRNAIQNFPVQLGKIRLCRTASNCKWVWVYLENHAALPWAHDQPFPDPMAPGTFTYDQNREKRQKFAHTLLQTLSREAETLAPIQDVLNTWPTTLGIEQDPLDIPREIFEKILTIPWIEYVTNEERELVKRTQMPSTGTPFFCNRRAFIAFHAFASAIRLVEELALALPSEPHVDVMKEIAIRFPENVTDHALDLTSLAPSNRYQLGLQFLRSAAVLTASAGEFFCQSQPQWFHALGRMKASLDILQNTFLENLNDEDRAFEQSPAGTPPPVWAARNLAEEIAKHLGTRLMDHPP